MKGEGKKKIAGRIINKKKEEKKSRFTPDMTEGEKKQVYPDINFRKKRHPQNRDKKVITESGQNSGSTQKK